MPLANLLAIAALLLAAVAVLPGTLGVVVFTHKLAATAVGARMIYRQSIWVLLISAVLMIAAVVSAIGNQLSPLVLGISLLAYTAVLAFGFLMHVGLNFKPVRKPAFVSIEDAIQRFGPDEEIIGVIDATGKAFAFVTRLARRPHVVYQPDGDNPFVMSHCILAHSSMSYAMQDNFADPDILVVAVIANNMVFYDKNSRCAVIQIQNQSRQGNLKLDSLSTVAVRMKTWQTLYPDSAVWVRRKEWRDTFYLKLLARADVIDPSSPVMIYPTEYEVDRRLPMKSQVLGVDIDGDECAYPVEIVQRQGLINDRLGNRCMLIAAACGGDFLQIYDRELEPGRVLEFSALRDDNNDGFTDSDTRSVWNPLGECVQGPLQGRQLNAIPHYNKVFWYVWADFHPATKVYAET